MTDADHDGRRRTPGVRLVSGVFLGSFAVALGAIVRRNGWSQPYTLDDPYIHLEVARRIFGGGYGINPGAIEAPSSSILWPLLLAPFAWLPTSALTFVPLVANLVLGVALCVQLLKLARDLMSPEGSRGIEAVALGSGLVLATNAIGLVFTGMEHVLQVLLTTMILRDLWALNDRGAYRTRLPWLLVLAPLVRYEMLAVSGPALLLMYMRGRRRPAAVSAGAMLALVGGFSLFLWANGLGLLPSSVVSKTVGFIDARAVKWLGIRLALNVGTPMGVALLASTIVLVSSLPLASRGRPFAVFSAVAVIGHLTFGTVGDGTAGPIDRYESYAVLLAIAAIVGRAQQLLGAHSAPSRVILSIILGIATLSPASHFGIRLLYLPAAVANIREQHYEMARFARDFVDGAVAVNDLGLISFLDDDWTVDLWGLSSREGLEARLRGEAAYIDWIAEETTRHGVEFAMVYPWLFDNRLPASWVPVADLRLAGRRISAGGSTVRFLRTERADPTATRGALQAFALALPRGVQLTLLD
jgi:hypothetical protein